MSNNIFGALLFTATLVGAFCVVILSRPFLRSEREPTTPWEKKAALETPAELKRIGSAEVAIENWPPVFGQEFPTVALTDHEGNTFDLKRLKGKPTLVEFVAMSCAGCQAFSGGNEHGGFGGFPSQENLDSIETYFKRYTGLKLHESNINFVQIIFYDLKLKSPNTSDLAKWRNHFQLGQSDSSFVLTGGEALANKASYAMIPGFLLLDSDLKITMDSTGHNPRHNLYTELLPAAKKLIGSLPQPVGRSAR